MAFDWNRTCKIVIRLTLLTTQHRRPVQDLLRISLTEGPPCLRLALSHLLFVEALSRLRSVAVLLHLCLVGDLLHLCLAEALLRQCLTEALLHLCLAEALLRLRLAEELLFLVGVLLLPLGNLPLQVLVASPFQHLAAHLLG